MRPEAPDKPPDTTSASRPPRPDSSIPAPLSSNRGVAVVQADYLALANDLDQAHALTSTLELQLSGKANELAQLKMLWERTRGDMRKFEQDIEALRKERHALANQVQNGLAAEHLLQKLKREHEQLQTRAEALETNLRVERTLHEDARRCIADLEQQLTKARPAASEACHRLDGGTRAQLNELREHLDRLLGPVPPKRPPTPMPVTVENIEISFSS